MTGCTTPDALRVFALLKRDFRKTPQLAAVQVIRARLAHQLDRADADQQMLVDAFAIEVVGHPR